MKNLVFVSGRRFIDDSQVFYVQRACTFLLCSFIEVYQDKIYDLLAASPAPAFYGAIVERPR